MGNFSTRNTVIYKNIMLTRDAKHFEQKGDLPAATYLNFFHSTKGGKDIPVDARVTRGAALFAGLKKGDKCIIEGDQEFYEDNQGNLRCRVLNADVTTLVDLKGRKAAETQSDSSQGEGAAPQPEPTGDQDAEGMGPAFD